jgi:hypothetical protein
MPLQLLWWGSYPITANAAALVDKTCAIMANERFGISSVSFVFTL